MGSSAGSFPREPEAGTAGRVVGSFVTCHSGEEVNSIEKSLGVFCRVPDPFVLSYKLSPREMREGPPPPLCRLQLSGHPQPALLCARQQQPLRKCPFVPDMALGVRKWEGAGPAWPLSISRFLCPRDSFLLFFLRSNSSPASSMEMQVF